MNGKLTAQEERVLRLLSQGKMYKEIAAEFDVTIDTIKKHCKNIYKKLEVRNRTEASNKFNASQKPDQES